MKQKVLNVLLGGALLLSAPLFTSCQDILGEWDRPTPASGGSGGSASEGVEYVAYTVSGSTATPSNKTATTYTEVTSSTTTWAAGTYVVSSDVTIDGNVTLSGDVELILCDGKTLTVNGQIASTQESYAPVNSLTVYGQTGGTGELKVTTTASEYSINCKNIYFHGGKLTGSNSEGTVGQVIFVTDELSVIAGTVKATSTSGVPVMIDQGALSVYDATLEATTAATNNVISNWGTGTFTIYSNTAVVKALCDGGSAALGCAITNGAAAALSYDTSTDGTTWTAATDIAVSGTTTPTAAYVRFPHE